MSCLLRVADAALRTGLSERTIRRLIAEGKLAVVRPAAVRAVLIPESALSSLMAGADREAVSAASSGSSA